MYNYISNISANTRRFYREGGIIIGKDIHGRPISIPASSLDGHALIAGKSGTGKSNLMFNLIKQVSRIEGSNIVLLDPHGQLSDRVISSETGKRLLYVSPGTTGYGDETKAVSFNTIGCNQSDETEIERITGWIRDLFANEDSISGGVWGPRLEVMFRVVLAQVIRNYSSPNLEDFAQAVTERKSMRELLENVPPGPARDFLGSQIKDWGKWMDYVSSTLNRILPLLSSNATRHLVSGRADSLNVGNVISNGGNLITLNISRSSFSEETVRIVSSLFLLKLWTSLMETHEKRAGKKRTYLFIDEFQAIPARVIENLLREGRKFGVSVILSSQYLDSGNHSLSHAVYGNVRNHIGFSLSFEDSATFSGLIPGKSERRKLADTLVSQRLHSAVAISQSIDGISGPLSFTPDLIQSEVDKELIESRKKKSLDELSVKVARDDPAPEEKSLHEEIIDSLSEFLDKNGIEIRRSVKIGRAIADAVFSHAGSEYVAEVEVSDVGRKSRVLSKLKEHSGRKLLLITPAGNAGSIHRQVAMPTRFGTKNGLSLEFPISDGGVTIYTRDISRQALDTTIIEYSEGKFRAYWNGTLRLLNLKHLSGGSTFKRELDHGRYSGVRNHIYRLMVETDRYAIRKQDLEMEGIISPEHLNAFLRSMKKHEADFIFFQDLFYREGASQD